jgi:hypothetical protein
VASDCTVCRNEWTGPDCLTCPGNLDPSSDCADCFPGWSGDLCVYEISIVDTVGDVGRFSSIAKGSDNLPIIAYQDDTNNDLKVAHCSDASCSGATITVINNGGEGSGEDISLAIGNDGYAVISYFHSSSTDLRVAHCENTVCTVSTVSAIDTYLVVGMDTSITLGSDGLPIMSYLDFTHEDLKVAHCSNQSCTSSTTEIVAPIPNNVSTSLHTYTSMAIGADNLPIVSYFHHWSTDLYIAHCNNTTCSSATIDTLDDSGYVGIYNSIAIGSDNLPVISYYDATTPALAVAHCNNYSCSSSSLSIVDSIGWVGQNTSIAIGTDGYPIISYRDVGNGDLKVAHCDNVSCSSATTHTVDISAGDVGMYSSIAIGSGGIPVISYYDYTNGDLKVARCPTYDCAP